MEKYQLLGLKSLVLKQQKTTAKSPTSSKKPVLKFQGNTSDLLSLTERGAIPKSGLSVLSPREEKNTEGPLEAMIRNIDKALEALKSANVRYALKLLQGVEKDLEQAAIEGRVLDRNLVIVCLFNMACVYQAMWSLENCLKYMDAVVYNLTESLAQEQSRSPSRAKTSPRGKSPQLDIETRASKLRRQNLLLKVYLQQSAILSHLERHEEALTQAKEAQKLMELIIQESSLACTALKMEISTSTKDTHRDLTNCSYGSPISRSTVGKTSREACSLFKDEISYTKDLLDFAKPFLQDFSKTVESLSKVSLAEIITMAKKSLTNWKTHLESGKSKSHRKGLSKNGLFFSAESKIETRSLLGVQHKAERLQNFNIEAVMQMNPMRYKDYAQKRTVANDLSRESLEEKVVYQSVIYFIMATEMRFIDNQRKSKDGAKSTRNRSKSPPTETNNAELYYLKAIEVVCRYVNGPCPYIEHIATRYFNHYGKDTKLQPEETPKVQADQEAQEMDEIKKIEPVSVIQKEVVKDFQRMPKENKEQTIRKTPSKEPHEKAPKSSTVSLVKKITQQVVEEKKQKRAVAPKSNRSELDNSNSSIKKVPEIKLFSKTSRKDLEDSFRFSSERTASPVSTRKREMSPEGSTTRTMSERSTTKMSPRDAPISARGEKEKEDRVTPELSYFGVKVKVPKLAIKRNKREERETVSFMNQSGSSCEAGFMSERGVAGSKGEGEYVKRVPKVKLSKQEMGNRIEDVDRFGMYKESLKIVNPHNSKDNTPDIIKKAGISQILEKEESLRSFKGSDTSREAIINGKGMDNVKIVYDPVLQKSIKAREKQGYVKGRDETMKRIYNTKHNTFAEFESIDEDKSLSREQVIKSSCESIEVFNPANLI